MPHDRFDAGDFDEEGNETVQISAGRDPYKLTKNLFFPVGTTKSERILSIDENYDELVISYQELRSTITASCLARKKIRNDVVNACRENVLRIKKQIRDDRFTGKGVADHIVRAMNNNITTRLNTIVQNSTLAITYYPTKLLRCDDDNNNNVISKKAMLSFLKIKETIQFSEFIYLLCPQHKLTETEINIISIFPFGEVYPKELATEDYQQVSNCDGAIFFGEDNSELLPFFVQSQEHHSFVVSCAMIFLYES